MGSGCTIVGRAVRIQMAILVTTLNCIVKKKEAGTTQYKCCVDYKSGFAKFLH